MSLKYRMPIMIHWDSFHSETQPPSPCFMHPRVKHSPLSPLSYSFTTSTVYQGAQAPPTPLWWVPCMDMWGLRPPSASSPAWCGAWGPATSWRRSCLPPASPLSMSWGPTMLAASRLCIYHVSSFLHFNIQFVGSFIKEKITIVFPPFFPQF